LQTSLPRKRKIARRLTPAMYSLESYNAKVSLAERQYMPRGQFDNEADAVSAARAFIDDQLRTAIGVGASFEQAYRNWLEFGEVPVIVAIQTEAAQVDFDPYTHAASQAQLIAQIRAE